MPKANATAPTGALSRSENIIAGAQALEPVVEQLLEGIRALKARDAQSSPPEPHKETSLPSVRHLERLMDDRRLMLFKVAAILGHIAEALDTHADPGNGSVSQNDGEDVQCPLRGAQRLINDTAEALEWPVVEEDAERLARAETIDRQTAEREERA